MKRLLAWFAKNKRPMPWRLAPESYHCWLSEIMMQQTAYEQALPYYHRFLKRFPTVQSLAQANEADVLKAWEGLGYYARARNLHKAARKISKEGWPTSAEGWSNVPGVGPYTAAALASVLDGEKVPVVDGNVARVFSRYWALADDFHSMTARARLADRIRPIMCGKPGDFNQAMMELGALVCKPLNPACAACPLAKGCKARMEGRTEAYPVKPKRKELPVRREQVAVISDGKGKVLLVQHDDGGLLRGLWDLPRLTQTGSHTQVFSHFRQEWTVQAMVGTPYFQDPHQVPLTTATRKVLTECGLL